MKKARNQKLIFNKQTVTVLTNLKLIIGGMDDKKNTTQDDTIDLTITKPGSTDYCKN